ncbi:MAG TPA: glucan biosynthesis protein, partial [Rhizobiaceae bacterium]|nr:glucan biosynthesis protein [Rhizobiaceae bacterium]
MAEISRRDALSLFISSLLATTFPGTALAGGNTAENEQLTFGPPQAFTFDSLKQRAAVMAGEPWKDGRSPHSEILQKIDYDAFQAITFNKNDALWNDGKGGSPVQLFHLGRYFQEPVHIHVVEGETAREILYRQSYFNMPADHPAHALPDDIGFSGFRLQEQSQDYDWLAFLGASYFRSSGALNQYGLSARGLAVDTALQKPEEFPRFCEIWLERKEGINDRVLVYALLDSPSVTGAYRFDCSKMKGVTMDVECSLYPRKAIERLGIAPLTSMYWYS